MRSDHYQKGGAEILKTPPQSKGHHDLENYLDFKKVLSEKLTLDLKNLKTLISTTAPPYIFLKIENLTFYLTFKKSTSTKSPTRS